MIYASLTVSTSCQAKIAGKEAVQALFYISRISQAHFLRDRGMLAFGANVLKCSGFMVPNSQRESRDSNTTVGPLLPSRDIHPPSICQVPSPLHHPACRTELQQQRARTRVTAGFVLSPLRCPTLRPLPSSSWQETSQQPHPSCLGQKYGVSHR